MAIHKLSTRQIAKLTKDGMYGDGGNLWLQVTNKGAGKSWLFRWTEHSTGRERVMGLGPLHTVSLEEARELALANRKLLLAGKDPKKERDNRILDEQIAQGKARTVRQIAEQYYDTKLARSPHNTGVLARRMLGIVNKTIGDMPIEKVDRKIILETLGLAELWVTKHPTAVALQVRLAQMFSWAIDLGYYTSQNPAVRQRLQNLLPKSNEVHKTRHRAALSYKDIGRFMEKLRAYRWSGALQRYEGRPPIALWLEFLILTGVRNSEVRLAQWKEFDFKHMIWNVPAEHRKTGDVNGEVRQIPITKHMLVVLEQAKQIAYPKEPSPSHVRHHQATQIFERARHIPDQSPDALVFPNSINQAFDPVFVARLIRESLKEPNVTPHGFRSTLRDWMRAETHFDDLLWHIQVDHVLGDKTSQAYGHDKLLDRRRSMMELWGEYCSKRATPEPKAGKVFKLSNKRRSA